MYGCIMDVGKSQNVKASKCPETQTHFITLISHTRLVPRPARVKFSKLLLLAEVPARQNKGQADWHGTMSSWSHRQETLQVPGSWRTTHR